MSAERLHQHVAALTTQLFERPLNGDLCNWLNEVHGVGSATFRDISEICRAGVQDGWLCNREAGGIKYGRIFKPSPELHNFSVDVVEMDSIIGPNHVHPRGEIDLIMPITPDAKFDGQGAGWFVYGPESQHSPTVSDGKALILYLLPEGAIQFT
jgi:hypothetical protein